MSADENIHLDVEGEAAEAHEVEQEQAAPVRLFESDLILPSDGITLEEEDEAAPVVSPSADQGGDPGPALTALSARARDLSLSITNPATLARKLRESLIDLVGPEQSRAYHIGATYDSEKGEVQFQIATVTPNFLARLQVERGIGTATGAGSNTGTRAQLEIAYQRTINGWEVAVGAGVSAYAERGGGVMEAARMLKERQGDDVQVGASFSVTVRR